MVILYHWFYNALFFVPQTRKKLNLIIILIIFLLLINPGVRETITALVNATFNHDSVEGASVSYRFELWKQAKYLISRSTKNLLFGYGEEGRNYMELGERLSVTGHIMRFESWDSEFAVLLLETGFTGLLLNLVLSTSIIIYLLRIFKIYEDENKYFILLTLIVVVMINFMMTNVKIFAVQFWFIYWGLLALCTSLSSLNDINQKYS